MKQLILIVFLIVGYGPIKISNSAYGQSYTTESKSCGSCRNQVSIYSTVGMTCPHCGVRWGYENENKSVSKNYQLPSYNYNDYDFNQSSGITRSNANLRYFPSKNAPIIMVVPAYSFLSILKKTGEWYHVEYIAIDNNLQTSTLSGYIHQSLVK
jgi:predicted RNA-binding Zn-ribbon protein involved in translation (DUF1610 family)